jgi:hypothetical protein
LLRFTTEKQFRMGIRREGRKRAAAAIKGLSTEEALSKLKQLGRWKEGNGWEDAPEGTLARGVRGNGFQLDSNGEFWHAMKYYRRLYDKVREIAYIVARYGRRRAVDNLSYMI